MSGAMKRDGRASSHRLLDTKPVEGVRMVDAVVVGRVTSRRAHDRPADVKKVGHLKECDRVR